VKQDKLAGLFTRKHGFGAVRMRRRCAALEAAEGEDFPGELEEDHGQKRPRSRKRKAQVAARPAKKVLNLGFLHQRE
jgi:hypothetical protein